ncbi:MAG: cytochrome c biogenesis protein CcsA [Deltaproteobacteria bacterium]|nr:cytochrome c biogenesis protein CcsA [Deltaproteobacteria bacterium]
MQIFWRVALPILSIVLLAFGSYLALFVVPREVFMGDVYRIVFVHVPTAWMAMLAFTINFFASIYYLLKSNAGADALAEASAAVGVFFATLLLITGSIWGRPTWGVWWTWDPRLTTAAVMWMAFGGYLTLRKIVIDTHQRAIWSAVVAIIIFVDIPLVWFSVKWWNSLHQVQSSASDLFVGMRLTLAVNAVAFLCIMVWLIYMRYILARRTHIRFLLPPVDDIDKDLK